MQSNDWNIQLQHKATAAAAQAAAPAAAAAIADKWNVKDRPYQALS